MARAFRVGVDAINLSADRRGMGRIVRAVLAYLGGARDVEVTLLARTGKARRALAREFPGTAVAGVREAWRHDRFDAVWYPWNGIRFPARAPGLLLVCDPFAFTYPHPDAVARWREQKPIRRGLQHAARIATISAWTRDELVGLFGLDETEIDVIPLAPDPSFVPGLGDPDPHALTGGKPFVLAVGLGDARKNGALLVEAFAGAFPDRDVTLVVAGSFHPDAERAQAQRHVDLLRLEPEDALLRALYRNADAVAVPSLAEGFGLVAVEALACGAPVIAAGSSALPDATRGAALLVDPHSAASWSAALREVVRDGAFAMRLRAKAVAAFGYAPRTTAGPAILKSLRAAAQRPR